MPVPWNHNILSYWLSQKLLSLLQANNTCTIFLYYFLELSMKHSVLFRLLRSYVIRWNNMKQKMLRHPLFLLFYKTKETLPQPNTSSILISSLQALRLLLIIFVEIWSCINNSPVTALGRLNKDLYNIRGKDSRHSTSDRNGEISRNDG